MVKTVFLWLCDEEDVIGGPVNGERTDVIVTDV